MADRKWNRDSAAAVILDTARIRSDGLALKPVEERLLDMGRLSALTGPELQSLATRIGRFAWDRRLYRADLQRVSRLLVEQQAQVAAELDVAQRGFVAAAQALIDALSLGDETVMERAEAWQIEKAVRGTWRADEIDPSVVDRVFVRSILEALIDGDRAAFRALLGTLGRELVTLASASMAGRAPRVTELLGYRALRSLQDVLNGVLHASRATPSSRTGATASVEVAGRAGRGPSPTP